ncbi:peptidase [Erwinia billingiae]|nr:peptidase [Erwinia billingiae]
MGALFVMFLLPLLTISGCTQTVYVPVPQPKISADLTAPTPIPPIPTPLLWQDSLVLNANLLTAIGQCNIDKAAIRKFEESR